MLTLRGIYGREMYETWYKMTVMLQSGLDITPGDHPPLRRSATSRRPSPPPGPATPARSSWTGRPDDGPDPMSTTPRADPLAFLDDEVAALQRAPPVPAAAGHVVAPRARSSRSTSARLISLSSNDYLGLTHHPRLREAALAAVREFGVGSGAVRTIAGHDVDARGARGGAGRLQGHARGPDVPVGLHRQHRGHPDDHRRDGPHRLATRSTTPRSSTACACRRRRARSTRTSDVDGAARRSSREARGDAAATGPASRTG